MSTRENIRLIARAPLQYSHIVAACIKMFLVYSFVCKIMIHLNESNA